MGKLPSEGDCVIRQHRAALLRNLLPYSSSTRVVHVTEPDYTPIAGIETTLILGIHVGNSFGHTKRQ